LVDIRNNSITPASNTGDWPEGMPPAAVNDEAREDEAEIAQLLVDLGGALALGGTATDYTVTLSTAPTALVNGLFFWATASTNSTGGATTLVVTPQGGSAFASKKIKVHAAGGEQDPIANTILAGVPYRFEYKSAADSATGAWIVTPAALPEVTCIASGTASAAGSLNIAMPTYACSKVVIELFDATISTNGAFVYTRVSLDNLSTVKFGVGDYNWAYSGEGALPGAYATGSRLETLLYVTPAATNTYPWRSTITIPNPAGTAVKKLMRFESEYNDATNGLTHLDGIGVYDAATSAITHLQFVPSGGTFTLSYRVYVWR
jgi:hypothetical protein